MQTDERGNADRVFTILDDEGTVDLDEHEQEWRAEGWLVARNSLPASADAIMTRRQKMRSPKSTKRPVVDRAFLPSRSENSSSHVIWARTPPNRRIRPHQATTDRTIWIAEPSSISTAGVTSTAFFCLLIDAGLGCDMIDHFDMNRKLDSP